MNAEEFSKQFSAQEINSNQAIVSEVNPAKIAPVEKTTTNFLREQVPSSIVLIGMTLLLTFLKKWSRKPKEIVKSSHSQFPCNNCRFFSLNSYRKCTIHPSIVLTAKANNCSDYWALNGKFLR